MKKIKLELGLVLLLAFFLYFWQIQKNQYFSYDQARDFLIIKKIIVDHKFTLIGPSLGIADGAYLPPWYYYLIAPALFISDFHLWGPDVLSAILGILGVFVFYLLARKMFGEKIAFLSSLFYVGNPFMIQAARHIRNPHLLPLFLLAFAYFSRAFLEDKRSSNLLLSSFFLGIALSMHITAIVFLPVLFYLFFIQIKRKKYPVIFVSALIPAGLFTPLLFFDLRHGFGISKAVASFFNHDGGMSLFNKTLRLTSFFYKIPLVLFSGNFQKQLLSLRSMPFFSLEQIGFGGISIIDFTKLVVSFIFFCFLLVFAYKGLREKRKPIKNNFKFIFVFIFFGFCVSFLLPKNYSYFYYFYNLFPFIFLLLSGCLFLFFEKYKKNILYLPLFFLVIIPLFPNGLKTETRPENFFLSTAKLISEDVLPDNLIAVAANLNDNFRWEKNALEYRYFLESQFQITLLGDLEDDYRRANVLYLVDEGNLADPLTLEGMEIKAFEPKKIDKIWKVETGQKIYKLMK